MAGFEPRVYAVEFAEDHELHGLTASFRAASIGDWITMLVNGGDDGVGGQEAEAFEREVFAACLVSWNLIDPSTGEPYPCTADGVAAAPAPEVRALKREWWDQTGRVPDPLGGRSTSGGSTPEARLPMEVSSAPRAS